MRPRCFVRNCLPKISHDRIRAELFPFASFAVFAHPYFIKLVHGLFDDLWVVGQYSGLEIACCFGFHADASACEVGATDSKK